MNRYPHKLYKVTVEKGNEDEFGEPVTGEQSTVYVSDCYEQIMGSSQEYKMNNGSSFYYSSKIFLPEGVEQIPTGTKIEIREGDGLTVRLKGEVKRPSNKDYKHSRIWL